MCEGNTNDISITTHDGHHHHPPDEPATTSPQPQPHNLQYDQHAHKNSAHLKSQMNRKRPLQEVWLDAPSISSARQARYRNSSSAAITSKNTPKLSHESVPVSKEDKENIDSDVSSIKNSQSSDPRRWDFDLVPASDTQPHSHWKHSSSRHHSTASASHALHSGRKRRGRHDSTSASGAAPLLSSPAVLDTATTMPAVETLKRRKARLQGQPLCVGWDSDRVRGEAVAGASSPLHGGHDTTGVIHADRSGGHAHADTGGIRRGDLSNKQPSYEETVQNVTGGKGN